ALVFGLLHGFGFAGALHEVGLPGHAIPLALFLFNVGVEAGQLLFVAAVQLRRDRDGIAALEVFEVAKPWREADADVGEAIDFLEYYGRRMLELAAPRRMDRAPGESNTLEYRPRGVAAVVAPWNFPLAILCGMSAAALVTGNSVVLKPAEQAPLCAWRWVEALRAAGAPPDLVQFLPGRGEVAGAALVSHPGVQLVAFTGSLATGLHIVEQAARARKGRSAIVRVIAELGGKNAIVIDSDADLDEAVAGVVRSAFGFAGQKCSACSRAIVVDSVHDVFVRRLVEATRALQLGPPADPRTDVPPLVDAEQQRSVRQWRETAASEGTLVYRGEDPGGGYYVAPAIVAGIEPVHRVAQEEIFGPVLSVMRASDFEHALQLANSTRFALTGAVYSRSPAHLERARRAFEVGNLYLNRPCTGALVERQPFGGFALSGMGSKAGGPDSLLQFLDARTVTENTLRRGFTRELLS
ncbi:MAG: aldehyde dehydrogenase family protein, partial [Myxococcota bacterium]